MIFNTTYNNQEYIELSNQLLGRSFSLLDKIKMNGVGSGRLMIAELSEKLKPKQKQFSEIDYGNIEMRPNGILVHFSNRLERFSWCIPYYKMVVYNSSHFSIHSEGSFIKFKKNKNYLESKKFIDKMIDFKNEHLGLSYYDG